MRKRSLARMYVLQMLYQIDITREDSSRSQQSFWQNLEDNVEPDIKEFAEKLVQGVLSNLSQIDSKISQYASNWDINRMSVVDRNILRLGCFELLFCEDIPPKVSINEAVDLAKKYSGIEAGKFVNGILDKIKTQNQ